jgi:hypothetical protein
MIRHVAHGINADRQGKVESLREIVGDGNSLRERPRLRVADIVGNVFLFLPLVQRMRLANVYGQKIRAVLVIIV